MSGIDMAHRMAIAAVVNGLRKSGEISDKAVTAIANELRLATAVSVSYNHTDTTNDLRTLADAIERGASGK